MLPIRTVGPQVPSGGIPVPPPHHGPQGGHQSSPTMGFPPNGPRGPVRMSPQQAFRPAPQQTGRSQQQTSYAHGAAASPQTRSPYPSRAHSLPHSHAGAVPEDFGGQAFIEVSDLTGEHITEEQYREFLTRYIIVSFEKIEPHDKYDSAGERVRPTWAKCTRRRMPNVDNATAREEIQRLNQETRAHKGKRMSLLEKQQTLGQKAQDQITRMARDLSEEEIDPLHFHTVLEQISWTLKPFVDDDKKSSRKHSTSKKKAHAKTKYERATITAYFKRCPRPDQSASGLYHRLALEKREQELLERQRDRDAMQMEIRKDEARLRAREERQREQERGHGPQQMRPAQQHMPQNQQMRPQSGPPMNQPHPGQVPQQRRPQMFQQGGPQMNQQQAGPMPQQRPQMMPPQGGPPTNQQPTGPMPQQRTQMPPPGGLPTNQQPHGQMPQQRPQMFQFNHGQPQAQQQQPPNGVQMPPQQGTQMHPTGQVPPPPPGFRLPNGQAIPPGPRIVTTNNGQLPLRTSAGNVNGHGAHPSMRPATPIRVIHDPEGRPSPHRRGRASRSSSPSSGSSSRSSATLLSDFDSGSDSEGSTIITEPSNSGSPRVTKASHYHRHHRHDTKYPGHSSNKRSSSKRSSKRSSRHSSSSKPRVPRYATEAANFGERRATRQHSVDARARPEPVSFVTRDGRRVQVAVPREAGAAAIPVEGLAQIRDDAYRLGRADQRAEAEAEAEAVEDLHSHSGRRRYQAASSVSPRYEGRAGPARTEIHQRERGWERDQLPRIRRVTRSEVDRQRDLDADFAGLRIGRETRLEDDLDDWNYRAQRRREARARDEQEEIMRGIEEDEERELRRRDMRSSLRSPFGSMPQGSGRLFSRP